MHLRLNAAWRWLYVSFCLLVVLVAAAGPVFTDQIRWGAEDFAAASGLFGLAYLAIELSLLRLRRRSLRIAALGLVAISLLSVWAHLAIEF
ncbi:hypothetical protein [Rhizobium sp. SSA_523]|uniref:hypothetical protein n=1 Tax=Rhizobium sp. SSA_523 TaxID=2952477 RepID=UPI002091A90F|nr:hypothetical protein [Rhizobium sp. SSA_523]MCO5733781.1 hypothetical protein [Rhizobium sp. SSA_523]WKC24944.1 hypothetical protein QTJ18_13125 [Rhizobium sp. SSA_523]